MEDEQESAKAILQTLKAGFSIPRFSDIVDDPFKVLIRTVISQSTAEVNTRRAYTNLSSKLPITPKALAQAELKVIEDAIRVAGLYRNKSKAIRELSKKILEKHGGSLDFIYSLPLEEAREKLTRLPGIGPKTADIILLFCAKKPTLPVDTHVNRVSKRLRLSPPNGGYEEVRRNLQALYQPEDYFAVHMLLIALGRKYCKALKPLCAVCLVKYLCPSGDLFLTSEVKPKN